MASPPPSSHAPLTGSFQSGNPPSQEQQVLEGPRPTLATIVLPPRRPVRGRVAAGGSVASSASSRHGSRRGSFASSTASRASSVTPSTTSSQPTNVPALARAGPSAMSASSLARNGRPVPERSTEASSSQPRAAERSRRRESDQSDSFEILERPSTFLRSTMTQRNPLPSAQDTYIPPPPLMGWRRQWSERPSMSPEDDDRDGDYEESPRDGQSEDDEVPTSRPQRRPWARPRARTPANASRSRSNGGGDSSSTRRQPGRSLLDELDLLDAANEPSSPPPLPISPPVQRAGDQAPANFPLSPSPLTQSRGSSPLTELSYHSEDERDRGAVIEPSNDDAEGRGLTREQKGKGRAVEYTSGSSEGEDGAPLRLRKRFSEIKGGQRRRQRRKLDDNGSHVETGGADGSASSQTGEDSGSGDWPVLLEPSAPGHAVSKEGLPHVKRPEVPKLEDRLDSFNCSICMCEPNDAVVTHCGHIYCSNCLLAAMLQAIARSPTVYDTNRPEPTSTTRNRRNAPKPPTWRNRGGQPKAWKPTELREAISDFKLVQENRTRASQAKELEGTLQAQGVPRTEWPAMIEAAGFSPLPPRPRPQPTAAAAARTDGPRPGAGRRIYLPGAYGDFAEAAGFGASDPSEHLDADEGDVKVKHVLQGLWKVEAGGWVVEGECPTCRNALPGGFASPGLGVGSVIPMLVRLRTRVQ